MIVAAGLCPSSPLLLRELTGRGDPAPDLRVACATAVRELARSTSRVVLVGAADQSGSWPESAPAGLHRYGAQKTEAAPPYLPLPLAVGRRLLREAGWSGAVELQALTSTADVLQRRALIERLVGGPERTAALFVVDGTLRRDESAPEQDAAARRVDAQIAQALADGDPAALASLDEREAGRAGLTGWSTYLLLAELAEHDPPRAARLLHRSDGLGVGFLVAVWRWEQAAVAEC